MTQETTTRPVDDARSRRHDTRNLFALSAGHALEWFDWAMF